MPSLVCRLNTALSADFGNLPGPGACAAGTAAGAVIPATGVGVSLSCGYDCFSGIAVWFWGVASTIATFVAIFFLARSARRTPGALDACHGQSQRRPTPEGFFGPERQTPGLGLPPPYLECSSQTPHQKFIRQGLGGRFRSPPGDGTQPQNYKGKIWPGDMALVG
jgi:hypothetical protein